MSEKKAGFSPIQDTLSSRFSRSGWLTAEVYSFDLEASYGIDIPPVRRPQGGGRPLGLGGQEAPKPFGVG